MIRQLGRSGIAEMVGRHCSVATYMAENLAAEDGVTLVCAVELNQFMLRFGTGSDAEIDRMTRAVIDQVQADAIAFIGGAMWRGNWVMRVSVTSGATDMAEAETTIAAVIDAFRRVR
jgi:glutamate/tyrosine decarboxylase-like PLP-dependent enzyme